MSAKKQISRFLYSFFEEDECCIICTKPIVSVIQLVGTRGDVVCSYCRSSWKGKLRELRVNSFHATYCYDYSSNLGDYFYRFKGVGDIRLADMFLFPYVKTLRRKFRDYILVRMPSWREDDVQRGFNHVEEIFNCLGLPIVCPFQKLNKEKQSEKSAIDRAKTSSLIGLDDSFDLSTLKNKNILLVDDVMTTGNTLNRAADLLGIKEPSVLVVAMHEMLSKKGDKKIL